MGKEPAKSKVDKNVKKNNNVNNDLETLNESDNERSEILKILNRKRTLVRTKSYKDLTLKKKYRVLSGRRSAGKFDDQYLLLCEEDNEKVFK